MEQPRAYVSRVVLNDFQKYGYAAFSLSEKGNMVIGRNGSGKSSLGAAIALALGATTRTAGKSIALHECIRFGQAQARIDLEITVKHREQTEKSQKEAREPTKITVTRIIARDESHYLINGEARKAHEVKTLRHSLGLKVESAAFYLPQDKISEFLSLTEEEQLELTLDTCDPGLLNEKKQLEILHDQIKEKTRESSLEQKTLDQKRELLPSFQEDAKQLEQTFERQERIKYIRSKIKWIEYKTARNEHAQKKKDRLDFQKGLQERAKQLAALQQNLGEKKEIYQKRNSAYLEPLKKHNELHNEASAIKDLERKIETALAQKTFAEKALVERRKEYAEYKAQAEKIKDLTARPLERFTPALKKELDALEGQYREEILRESEWQAQTSVRVAEIRSLEIKLQQEKEEEEKKMETLRQLHPDTYNAAMLIREREEKQEKKIHVELPALLTLKITRQDFSEEVSSQLGLHALTSFVCHSPQDFREFVREYKEKEKLAVNVVERQPSTYAAPQPPTIDPGAEMVYLSDCIEAPEATREFLNVFCKLSHIPATKKEIDEEKFFGDHPKISRVISNKKVVEIKRSRYTEDKTLIVSPISKGLHLGEKHETTKYAARLEELKIERESRRVQREAALKKKTELSEKIKELRSLKDADEKERERCERKKRSDASIREKALALKNELSEVEQQLENTDKILDGLNAQQQKLLKSVSLFGFLEDWEEACRSRESLAELEAAITQDGEDIMYEKEHLASQKEKYNLLKKEEGSLSALAKAKMEEAAAVYKVETEEAKELMKSLPGTISSLNSLAEQEQAKLDLTVVNRSAIDALVSLQREIEILEASISARTKCHDRLLQETSQKGKAVKEKMSELEKSINDNLQRLFAAVNARSAFLISTSGHPRQWKTQLKVQFRSSGDLELLSAGRQSGGEKSVSIILYLLSLKGVSRSFFFLVDEINQGMDATHERIVHDLLLGEGCLCNGQIIVITPKLAKGLSYANNTKIHVVTELS